MAKNLDLDVESAEQVPNVLRAAAEAFGESSGDWPWEMIADILNQAADEIGKRLKEGPGEDDGDDEGDEEGEEEEEEEEGAPE